MKQKIILTFLIFLFEITACFLFAKTVAAQDIRAQKLATFLSKYNSPLAYFSNDFVQEADRNGLDYRLLPAIAGVESTFARNFIPETHNVYGWGGGEIGFQSWPDGITKVSLGLKKGYLDKGAGSVEDIAKIYCPPNSSRWAQNVRLFMEKIEATVPAPEVLTPAVSKHLSLTI